jgi:transcriptional regulator with XRE-family HTH domain
MKRSKESIYNELAKTYSDEELADSVIMSIEGSPAEQKEIDEEFIQLRLERLKSMTDEEIILYKLYTFKLRLDKYFKSKKFNQDYSFAAQLKEYVGISDKSNADLASDLGIHKTKLSRLANNREKPNVDLMYRLEEHSGKTIPAIYWWRLYSKELEHRIKQDYERRRSEAQKVSNPLKVSA